MLEILPDIGGLLPGVHDYVRGFAATILRLVGVARVRTSIVPAYITTLKLEPLLGHQESLSMRISSIDFRP